MNASKKMHLLFCGTLLCLATALTAATPGLYESRYQTGCVRNANYPAPTNARITLAPYAAQAWGTALGQQNYFATAPGPDDTVITNWPPPAELYDAFTGNTTFRYTGYIHIPEGSNTLSFIANFDCGKRFCLDDTVVFSEPSYARGCFETLTVPTGWHKFDVWFDDDGAGYGCAWGGARMGFGIDWLGRDINDFAYFTFPEDPGDGSIFSADFPADGVILYARTPLNVLDASVSLPVYVEVDDTAFTSGTLRLYYTPADENTDADDYPNWPYVDFPAAIMQSGEYTIDLTGLDTGVTYWYRHALLAGAASYSPLHVGVVTTADYYAPSRFLWTGGGWGQGARNWNRDGNWQNLDSRPRTTPGVAGDALYLRTPLTCSVQITNDIAFGSFTSEYDWKDNWGMLHFRPRPSGDTPVTLRLDPGAGGGNIKIGGCSVPNTLIFGESSANAYRDTMRLHLAAPLDLIRNAWGLFMVGFHAPVTGGTDADPATITIGYTNPSWVEVSACLANTNNTFRGDIILTQSGATLYIGTGGEDHQAGWAGFSHNAHDGMFGDPKNKVILRNNAGMYLYDTDGTFALNRTIIGTGILRSATFFCQYGDAKFAISSMAVKPLRLGPGALLSPGEGTALGTLRLRGSDLECDPGTTFRVKLLPDGTCDRFILDIPGTIALNGARVELDTSAFEALAPARGTTWPLATTIDSGATITGNLRSATPGFIIRRETNPETGVENFVATRAASIFILR